MGSLIMSNAVGPLIATALVQMDGLGGLAGWQWLFLLEGVLGVIVGAAFFFMPAGVDQVKRLTSDEKGAVHASFALQPKPYKGSQMKALRGAVKNPAMWVATLIKFCRDIGFHGVIYWLPSITKDMLGAGASNTQVLLMSAIPYLVSSLYCIHVWCK
jgi:MFS family permease